MSLPHVKFDKDQNSTVIIASLAHYYIRYMPITDQVYVCYGLDICFLVNKQILATELSKVVVADFVANFSEHHEQRMLLHY